MRDRNKERQRQGETRRDRHNERQRQGETDTIRQKQGETEGRETANEIGRDRENRDKDR